MIKHLCIVKTGFKKHSTNRGILMALISISLIIPAHIFAQSSPSEDTDSSNIETTHIKKKEKEEPGYPKVVGYLSFIIPVATHQGGETTTNFSSATSIGFPTGVNVLYSRRFGFSYEFTPTIKTINENSKMSNLLFDPGPMFRFNHGFTIITRLAFETSGRYGFTPVFNQVYLRTKEVNYFVALSLPYRIGADNGVQQPGSIGLNLQIGFTFN